MKFFASWLWVKTYNRYQPTKYFLQQKPCQNKDEEHSNVLFLFEKYPFCIDKMIFFLIFLSTCWYDGRSDVEWYVGTRMHSSRMRTARSLTDRISWYQAREGMCGMHAHQACTPPACTPPSHAHLPPWTEFLTHASENITLPETSFASGNNTW